MKIALVHELLTKKGGAEKVCKEFYDLYPEAPIYTLLYDERAMRDLFGHRDIRTGKVQRMATLWRLIPPQWQPRALFNHHLYLPFFGRDVERWDFSAFDLVLSSSSAFAHRIRTTGDTKHLCYVHSPARYLWDRTHDVRDRASSGLLGKIKALFLSLLFHRLRQEDALAANRADVLITPSKEVARRIELYWNRSSVIIPPPIDDCFFQPTAALSLSDSRMQQPSFLIVSQLVAYKKIGLAIEACNRTGLQLIIAGDGPYRSSLERMAGPTIDFRGFCPPEELRELYAHATATIIPGEEDFCIAAIESMACGTPVIAYAAGGVLETVTEGKTGTFFQEPTVDSLLDCLQKFDQKKYSKGTMQRAAKQYSRRIFEERILSMMKNMCVAK